MVDFKDRLCELLAEASESDAVIASNLGVSKQTISSWKNGIRSPKRPTIEYLANYFGVNVSWLMGYDVPRDSDSPAVSKIDDEPDVWEIREQLRRNPELHILFAATDKATAEDILEAAELINARKTIRQITNRK